MIKSMVTAAFVAVGYFVSRVHIYSSANPTHESANPTSDSAKPD